MLSNDFDIIVKFYTENELYKVNNGVALDIMAGADNAELAETLSKYDVAVLDDTIINMSEGINKARKELGEV